MQRRACGQARVRTAGRDGQILSCQLAALQSRGTGGCSVSDQRMLLLLLFYYYYYSSTLVHVVVLLLLTSLVLSVCLSVCGQSPHAWI